MKLTTIPRFWTALALILVICATFASAAVTYPERPGKDNYIADTANIIGQAEANEINQIAGNLLQEMGIPIIVVTIPSLADQGAAGLTIEAYAMSLFNTWGIGSEHEHQNRGMLLLVSPGDRQARIELGATWGRDYDSDAQRIMDTLIVPEFRSGNYSAGVLAGVRGLDSLARGQGVPRPKPSLASMVLGVVLIAVIIGVIVSLFKSGHKGWGWALIIALGALLFFMMRASARGGGGGGAFGGGFSGGGGATGSW